MEIDKTHIFLWKLFATYYDFYKIGFTFIYERKSCWSIGLLLGKISS